MEHSNQTSKSKKVGTQGTLLVAKNDARMPNFAEYGEDQAINLDQPALIGLAPPFSGRRFRLRLGKTTIGRRNDNDIVLADGSVSSLHAWIVEDHGSYRLMNILSTNGSFVNNERINETLLKEGDHIQFGGVELQFYAGLGTQKSHPSRTLWIAAGVIGLGVLVALGLWFVLK